MSQQRPTGGHDPAAAFQAMQSEIQRVVPDPQRVLRPALDGMGNSMSMRWSKDQRLEDQQVESTLEHFALQRRFVFRLSLYTPVDDRLE